MSYEIPSEAESFFELVDRERLARHLDVSAGIRRDTGGPGEEEMVRYIVDTLAESGVPVTVHEFDALLSYPRSAVVEVLSPERFQVRALTHAFAAPTGPNGRQGSLAVVPDKDMRKAAGRIGLVDGVAMPIEVLNASREGLTALVFSNPDWYLHNMIVSTVWGGTPTPEQAYRLPSVPVVSISHQDGERLKALVRQGPVEMRVRTEVDTGWYRVKLPEVRIPGAGPDEDFVLVGGHYCSWEVGTTDNSTGIAALLEMARVLWERREQLQRGVRFAWWPGHSHGRYAGSTWYADTFFEDLAERCVAYHNIDSPGVKGATKYLLRHTSAEIEAFGRTAIETLTEQRDPEVHRPSRSADQSFLANGLPSCSLYSFLPDGHPDRKPWTGGCAGAWWWHSEHDTRDKADEAILEKDVRLSLGFVIGLANRPVHPFEFTKVAEELRDFVAEAAEAGGTDLDLARTKQLADELVVATQGLSATLQRGAQPERANRVLKRLARVLIPLSFTTDGRYVHEGADIVPMMSTHRASLYPGLNRVFNLASAHDANERGFLLVKLRRQVNRFNDQIKQAIELAGSL